MHRAPRCRVEHDAKPGQLRRQSQCHHAVSTQAPGGCQSCELIDRFQRHWRTILDPINLLLG
jgi:hypothetical protein